MKTLQTEIEPAASSTDKVLFWKQVQHELDEIHQEAEEAYVSDDEIDPVPDSAYHDAYLLLEILFNHDVSTADIGWLADGGIGFEWRSTDGKRIATMSIYGDNQVVYGASLGNTCKVKGTCFLTDLASLVRFFPMLKALSSQ